MLLPMYFIIGIWGGPNRVYAAVKFILYTMVGSVLMLVAILGLYYQYGAATGRYTFDVPVLAQYVMAPGLAQNLMFLAFAIAFAVKVPLFPLHTWLPDAHVEAPAAGSVVLAGVLLKMGTYGLLRFNVGLFPDQAHANAAWINVLAIVGIIYGALVALVQPNMKKLVAYSSVSHLGFCVLGIFSLTQAGIDGSVYQMLNHGISTGALFMLLGVLYDRRHTYIISEYGGLGTPMPHYSMMYLFILLSSVGLPLMNGFVGEFLVLSGASQANIWYGVFATTGVIWSAGYMLWLYQRTFYGEPNGQINASMQDATMRERIAIWPLAA